MCDDIQKRLSRIKNKNMLFIFLIFEYYDVYLEKLSGWEETASFMLANSSRQQESAESMPLICKLTNPETYLLSLVPVPQKAVFLCLKHPGPGAK